jgi:hypothetical protein
MPGGKLASGMAAAPMDRGKVRVLVGNSSPMMLEEVSGVGVGG